MKRILFAFPVLLILFSSCGTSKNSNLTANQKIVPNIDLSHWKVQIPLKNEEAKVISVRPPEIENYANIDVLKEFMYPDSTDGSIVFYAYPAQTTGNTKYSRTELREQMEPGSDKVNWTFKQGGYMKVTLSVPEVSKDEKGKYHKIIIAQIHGRLTNEQKELIGQKDNNAPPILKVYWQDGKIRVKTKILADKKVNDIDILKKEAWVDDEGYYFQRTVNNQKVTIEVIVTDGRMEVILDGREKAIYNDKSIKRWGIFENYFKTGNYFNSRDEGSFGKVKIYELEVSH